MLNRFIVYLLAYRMSRLFILKNIEPPILYFPKENITECEKISVLGIDLS